jgi:hypothetical protein
MILPKYTSLGHLSESGRNRRKHPQDTGKIVNARLAIAMLASLVVTARLAGTKCDPLPTLQISDVRTTLIGHTLRKDRVIDGTASKDSEPLPFAEVRLNSGKKLVQRTTTDAQGHFLLESIPLGRYSLSFEGMGSFSIEVTPPRFSQQYYYSFSSVHGCLSWGEITN